MECLFCYKLTFDDDNNDPLLTCPGPDDKTRAYSTLSKIFQIENTEYFSTSTPICQECTGKLLHVDQMLLEIQELQLKINGVKNDLFGSLIKSQDLSERDGKSLGSRVKLIEELHVSFRNGDSVEVKIDKAIDFPFFKFEDYQNKNSTEADVNDCNGYQGGQGDGFFDHQVAGHSTYDYDNGIPDRDQDSNQQHYYYSSNILPKNLPILRIILEPIQIPNYCTDSDNNDSQVISFNINEEPIASFIQRDTKKVTEIQLQRIHIFEQNTGKLPSMGKSLLPLECSLCNNMKFSCRGSLNRHRRHKHPETKFIRKKKSLECLICNMKFSCRGSLGRHRRNKHKNTKSETVNLKHPETKTISKVEGLKLKPKSRGKLPSISMDKPSSSPECHLCNMKFSCRGSFNRHRRHKHQIYTRSAKIRNPESKFECLICNMKFSCRGSLGRHRRKKHPESKTSDISMKRRHNPDENYETFYCDKCPQSFSLKYKFRLHVQRHHCPPVRCTYEYCDKIFKNMKTLKFHIMSLHASSKDYPCTECSKTFAKSWLLSYHVKLVHSGQTWVCEYCSRVMTSKINLSSHIKTVHMKIKNYKYFCSEPECNGRGFEKPSEFKHHMERIHQKLKEFECPSCPPGSRKFYCASGLKRHTNTHTREKPYVCQYCSKGFGTLHNVKLHEKSHLETDREISFHCRKRKSKLTFWSNS